MDAYRLCCARARCGAGLAAVVPLLRGSARGVCHLPSSFFLLLASSSSSTLLGTGGGGGAGGEPVAPRERCSDVQGRRILAGKDPT
jgi:hypothetical protein